MAMFTEFFGKLRHDCEQLHESRQQLYDDLRSGIQKAAEEIRSELMEFGAEVREGGNVFRRGHATSFSRPARRKARKAARS